MMKIIKEKDDHSENNQDKNLEVLEYLSSIIKEADERMEKESIKELIKNKNKKD